MGVVYLATNKLNGKRYIGWTVKLRKRKWDHQNLVKNGSKTAFHNAIRKYGWNAFEWDILFRSKDKLALKEVEILRIAKMDTMIPSGYNMTEGGDGFSGSHSDETKRKISKNSAARRPEVRVKISKAHQGRIFSDDHKRHLTLAARKNITNEQRERFRQLGRAKKGIRLSEETKKKMKDSWIGKDNPAKRPEVRRKISKAVLGRPKSLEHRLKISQTLTGRKNGPPSDLTKSKIAASVKKSWIKRRLAKAGV